MRDTAECDPVQSDLGERELTCGLMRSCAQFQQPTVWMVPSTYTSVFLYAEYMMVITPAVQFKHGAL